MAIIVKERMSNSAADGFAAGISNFTPAVGGALVNNVDILFDNFASPYTKNALSNYTFANAPENNYRSPGVFPVNSTIYGLVLFAPDNLNAYDFSFRIRDNKTGIFTVVRFTGASRQAAFAEFTCVANADGYPDIALLGLTAGAYWLANAFVFSDVYINQNIVPTKLLIKNIGDSTTEGVEDNVLAGSSSLNAYSHKIAEQYTIAKANSFKRTYNGYVVPEGQYLPTPADYDANKLITIQNFGVGGKQTDQMIASFNADNPAQDSVDFNKIWINFFGGLNDFGNNTATPAKVYENYQAYAVLCANNGISLRVFTVPHLINQPIRDKVIQLNALLRNDHSWATDFVDLERNIYFVNPSNSTYFSADGVHYKAALNAKLGELAYRAQTGALTYPAITTNALANALLNTFYSQILTATGATNWQFKSGTLPNGINFEPAQNRFVGTATQSGTFNNIKVWAIDADGNYDEKIYSLTVDGTAQATHGYVHFLDSLTIGLTAYGEGGSASQNAYPHKLAVRRNGRSFVHAGQVTVSPTGWLLGENDPAKPEAFLNYGVSGRELIGFATQAVLDAEVLPHKANWGSLTLVLLAGANDIVNANRTPAEVKTAFDFVRMWCIANNVGLKILTLTTLGDGLSTTNSWEIRVRAVNNLLRNDVNFNGKLIDIARYRDMHLPTVAMFGSQEILLDGGHSVIHFIPAGYTRIAELVDLGLNGAMGFPTITTTALPNGTKGQPYTANLVASGGTGAKTFEVLKGEGFLAAGLSLNSMGELSGTPTTYGAFSVKYLTTDAAGATDEKTLVLNIANAAGAGVVFFDDFDRADGVIGNGWIDAGYGSPTGNTVNNRLKIGGTGGTFRGFRRNIAAKNCKVTDVFIAGTGTGGKALMIRQKPNGEAYFCYNSNSSGYAQMGKISATGVIVNIGGLFPFNIIAGDVMSLEANESVITFSQIRNGVETVIHQITDATIPNAGYSGVLNVDFVDVTIDEFRFYNNDVSNPGNTAPTISAIADVTINEDENTAAITFTIGDAETAAGSLNVAAVSNNTTLIPNNNVVFAGSGANRTMQITPAANQFGTSLITVTVGDGTASTTETFLVTVSSVNDVPTISAIADVVINEDNQTSAISFTVSDVETSASALFVTAVSSNQTLIPNANIALAGSGANRTIQATPAANQFGNSTITVTVSDGVNTSSEVFVITVSSVDDVPMISNITDRTTTTTTPVTVNFTVGDVETAAGSLNVTATSNNQNLLPNANLLLGGAGANRTLQATAASGQTGTAVVTVIVSDGVNQTSDTFVVTVNSAVVINTKRIRVFWGVADGNPQGYRVRKTRNGVTEIINAYNSLELFDLNVAENDVLIYEVAAYKGNAQGQWTTAIQRIFTNN